MALLAGLVALAGCATGGLERASESLPGGGKPATGSAVASTILAALGTGLIGSATMSSADRRKALEAEYRALEYTPAGQGVKWQGGGASGEVVASQPYRVGSQDCRQYSHSFTAGGPSTAERGTACRNADGSWTPLA